MSRETPESGRPGGYREVTMSDRREKDANHDREACEESQLRPLAPNLEEYQTQDGKGANYREYHHPRPCHFTATDKQKSKDKVPSAGDHMVTKNWKNPLSIF